MLTLFSLKGDVKITTPIGNTEVLGGFKAALD